MQNSSNSEVKSKSVQENGLESEQEKTLAYIRKNVRFLVGDISILTSGEIPALTPFSKDVIEFLDTFAKKLLKYGEAKLYPDLITLGFWCRKASVSKMKEEFATDKLRLGRGVAFHIAPSNVAVNFAYSLIASLLAGNSNIVRLPSKDFRQIEIIAEVMNECIRELPKMKNYVTLVRYERDKKINDVFSALCDIRIIWGGDNTISTLRQSPIGFRTKEICFADRYSVCVINSDEYVKNEEYKKVAEGFYNDTYLSDQNACNSPKLIVWMGSDVEKAKELFWSELYKVVSVRYELSAVQIVGKLDTVLNFSGQADDGVNPKYSCYDEENKIMRVEIDAVDKNMMELRQNSGLFFEITTDDLSDISAICTNKLQTMGVYGVDKAVIEDFVLKCTPRGIDRVVPIGKTLDFSLIWDGYNLVDEMSREVSVLI
ncbi:MAG: hypothetical protein IJ167_04435 [Lachnospiraceae bacterium]|nr:hypothetical protein [Lachnospiraceae bacterium]